LVSKLDIFSQAMSAAAVAKVGYEGYRKNEDIVIPGWKNRLMVTGIGFLPRLATRKIVGKMQGICLSDLGSSKNRKVKHDNREVHRSRV